MATPCSAAITGLGEASTAAISSRELGEMAALGVLNSRISAPEQNARPPPISTMAFTVASAIARCSAPSTPLRKVCASVFIGGLLKRITAIPSATLVSTTAGAAAAVLSSAAVLRRRSSNWCSPSSSSSPRWLWIRSVRRSTPRCVPLGSIASTSTSRCSTSPLTAGRRKRAVVPSMARVESWM